MYLREGVELMLILAPAVEAAEAVSFLRSNDDVKKKKTIFSLQKQFQVCGPLLLLFTSSSLSLTHTHAPFVTVISELRVRHRVHQEEWH